MTPDCQLSRNSSVGSNWERNGHSLSMMGDRSSSLAIGDNVALLTRRVIALEHSNAVMNEALSGYASLAAR